VLEIRRGLESGIVEIRMADDHVAGTVTTKTTEGIGAGTGTGATAIVTGVNGTMAGVHLSLGTDKGTVVVNPTGDATEISETSGMHAMQGNRGIRTDAEMSVESVTGRIASPERSSHPHCHCQPRLRSEHRRPKSRG
jgi:hypothetical protein